MKPGLKQRLFCDICDVFDAHDTDDCPTQSSTSFDSQGIQHHGNRNEERPYCGTCESKFNFNDVPLVGTLNRNIISVIVLYYETWITHYDS